MKASAPVGVEGAALGEARGAWGGDEARGDALERLAAAVAAAPLGVGPQRIVVAADAGPPHAWFDAAGAGEAAWYFAGRDGGEAVCGVGAAAEVGAREASAGPPGWRFFGAGRFEGAGAEGRFWAARVEVGREGERGWVAANLPDATALGRRRTLALIAAMVRGGPARLGEERANAIVAREERPGREAWEDAVRRALGAIAAGELSKVVLARRVELGLARPLGAAEALGRLAASEPRSFRYGVREGGSSFVGASPERLFARRGREVVSEAVAGTRRRGEDATGTEAAAAALLGSEKDRREHAVVVEAVREALDSLCTATRAGESPGILALGRLVHLHTVVAGTLADGAGDVALLEALHPTPAVCGWPTAAARRWIGALEAVARGRYAAPIGWIGSEGAELAVGLRGVELAGRRVVATAGAGIVSGSAPEEEWRETEAKLAAVFGSLGVGA